MGKIWNLILTLCFSTPLFLFYSNFDSDYNSILHNWSYDTFPLIIICLPSENSCSKFSTNQNNEENFVQVRSTRKVFVLFFFLSFFYVKFMGPLRSSNKICRRGTKKCGKSIVTKTKRSSIHWFLLHSIHRASKSDARSTRIRWK